MLLYSRALNPGVSNFFDGRAREEPMSLSGTKSTLCWKDRNGPVIFLSVALFSSLFHQNKDDAKNLDPCVPLPFLVFGSFFPSKFSM
jgi:hypothetical protein